MWALASGALQPIPAQAEAAADCTAINLGALDVSLDVEASAAREASLRPGDALTITLEAAAGPFGTVLMRQGEDSRSLLVGPGGTRVTFTAAKAGTVSLEFSRDGADAAAFKTSCAPGRGKARGRAATAKRHHGDAMGRIGLPLEEVEEFAVAELAGVAVDGSVVLPAPVKADSFAALTPVASVPGATSAVDMTMSWRGDRYSFGGPNGLELDHSRSGVDAAVNYKPVPDIMISALAQIDQPGETMINPPRDMSEQGWMAGPAATVKLAPSLSLGARAAWGIAETGGDPLTARAIAVPRRAVSAKLESSQVYGPWRFSPSVTLNHTQEEVFVVGADGHDPGASHVAGFGRVDVAPAIAYRIDLDRSLFVEPRAVIGGFWAVDNLSKLAPAHSSHGDMRFKAEAGLTVGAGDGTKLQASGGVEEGEAGMGDVWSGRLQLSVPMR